MLGVKVVTHKVVINRNRVTGSGVTVGIDFGLVVASQICGENETAFKISSSKDKSTSA